MPKVFFSDLSQLACQRRFAVELCCAGSRIVLLCPFVVSLTSLTAAVPSGLPDA